MNSPKITPINEHSPLPEQSPPPPRWTPQKQRTFLEALARCGSVKSAAAYTGMSRESAYRLRRRPEQRAFARAWDAALIHARDIFADELLDKGLNGWTETVWYHGEEVGERSRFSPHLLLSALGRLDKQADGIDRAGHPARTAAPDFDAMVEAIGAGEDCADMLAEQDRVAGPDDDLDSLDHAMALELLEERQEMARIDAMAPEDVDVDDLNPAKADEWDVLQWHRAEHSGMTKNPDFWEKVEGGQSGKSSPNGPGLYSV